MLEWFKEIGWLVASLAGAVFLFLPGRHSQRGRVTVLVLGVLLGLSVTLLDYYLKSGDGRGLQDRAACVVFPNGAACVNSRQPPPTAPPADSSDEPPAPALNAAEVARWAEACQQILHAADLMETACSAYVYSADRDYNTLHLQETSELTKQGAMHCMNSTNEYFDESRRQSLVLPQDRLEPTVSLMEQAQRVGRAITFSPENAMMTPFTNEMIEFRRARSELRASCRQMTGAD